MPILVACSCGKRFRAADQYVGRQTKCPSCGQSLVVGQSPPAEAFEPLEVIPDTPAIDQLGAMLGPAGWPEPSPGFPPGPSVPTPGHGAFPPGYQPNPLGYNLQGLGAMSGNGMPSGGDASLPQGALGASKPSPARDKKRPAVSNETIGKFAAAGVLLLVGVAFTAKAMRGLHEESIPRFGRQQYRPPKLDDAASQDRRQELVEKYIAALNSYAELLGTIRSAEAAEPHLEELDRRARDVQRLAAICVTEVGGISRGEDDRLSELYLSRMEQASARMKSEEDRVNALLENAPQNRSLPSEDHYD